MYIHAKFPAGIPDPTIDRAYAYPVRGTGVGGADGINEEMP